MRISAITIVGVNTTGWRFLPAFVIGLSLVGLPAAVAATDGPPSWMGDIPGVAAVTPDAMPPDAAIALAGCTQTLNLFQDDPSRVRPFVPSRYELGENAYFGPNVATLFSSILSCNEARVGHGSSAPMLISMVGVQVRSAATPEGPEPFRSMWNGYNRSTLNFLPSSSWYLISSETNNASVAERLTKAGLDIETVPNLAFETKYFGNDKTDVAVVPSTDTPYRVRTTTLFPDCCFVHNHDFMFFHDGPSGTTAFLQHLNRMIDSSCGYQLHGVVNQLEPNCGGEIETRAATPVADLFGASARKTSMSFNHPDNHAWGYISLRDVKKP
jgi:hypothetical protein